MAGVGFRLVPFSKFPFSDFPFILLRKSRKTPPRGRPKVKKKERPKKEIYDGKSKMIMKLSHS